MLVKELQKFFKEVTHENSKIWLSALDLVSRYDSPDLCETLGTDGLARIEEQADSSGATLDSVQLENPTIVAKTLAQHVEPLVAAKQEKVLEAMKTAASTADEEMKVACLASLNENDSVSLAIKNTTQPGAIPMFFAVFSRKNDGYGLG
jgi:hypothetical protein